MATSLDTVHFICDQAGLGARLTFRKMFGEYALYMDGKVVAFVCDEQLFLKPTPEARRYLGKVVMASPYPNAKGHFLLTAELDDPEQLGNAFRITADALPAPRARSSRPRGASRVEPSPELLRFTGGAKRDARIDAWIAAQSSEPGKLAARWFARLRKCGKDVVELLHDGFPTVCVADAPFAYVAVYKAHANLGFFRGAQLPDPAHLLQGKGRNMRHVKLRPGDDVPLRAVEELVAQAYRDIKKRLAAS